MTQYLLQDNDFLEEFIYNGHVLDIQINSKKVILSSLSKLTYKKILLMILPTSTLLLKLIYPALIKFKSPSIILLTLKHLHPT